MPGLYSRYIKLTHALGDIVAVAVSAIAAYFLAQGQVPESVDIIYSKFFLFSLVSWVACAALLGTYKAHRVTRPTTIILDAGKLLFLYILLLEAALNMFESNFLLESNFPPRLYLNLNYAILAAIVFSWRMLVYTVIRMLRRKGYNYRNVIIAGYGKDGIALKRLFERQPEHGYRFMGYFDDQALGSPQVVGTIDDIPQFVLQNDVEEIYCCPFELGEEKLEQLVDFVDNNFVRMKFLPDLSSLPDGKLKVDFNDLLPVLVIRSIPLDDIINRVVKRTFDIIFSLFVIIFILSWLLPLLGILIKLDSKGPVFFKQDRSGLDNKTFKCWKLRSMYTNAEANVKQAHLGDSRITPVGAFIRRTSLDELPQFFNVLLGQMSVVGPRPHMLKHTEEYSQRVDKFMVRQLIKPGITGLSQVRGYRGDTSELYQMKGRVKLDLLYLENWTFMLDLKIIFYTVHNVLFGDEQAF